MTAELETLRGCARCGGDHIIAPATTPAPIRGAVVFRPFTRPVEDSDGTLWTYWALSPANGEPILQKTTAKPFRTPAELEADREAERILGHAPAPIDEDVVEAHERLGDGDLSIADELERRGRGLRRGD